MTLASTQLQKDFSLTDPDAHIVAEAWVNAASRLKGVVPGVADLAEMITGISTDLTMQGAPQLEIDLFDQDWTLMDSGFLDPVGNGMLDSVEIQYGNRVSDGKPYYWRLFQVSPRGADFTIQTYWIPRVVDDLMNLRGPFSASRSSRTRAQFMQMCVQKVPYARLHSRQLDVVQPIAPIVVPTSLTAGAPPTGPSARDKGGKKVGIGKNDAEGMTIQGQPMGPRQRDIVNTLLRVADQLNAGKVATEALIYAATWESNMEAWASNTNSQGTFWGVLSGNSKYFHQFDTTGMARAFLLGDSARGFQGGGAIALSQTISNPIEIAVKVEVPSIWPKNAYASNTSYPGDNAALQEVDTIIQTGGGPTGPGGTTAGAWEQVQQYNFTIGTPQDIHEDFWTGMNRLAQEVNWELIVDGDDVFYDSDITICRSEVAAVIDRKDEGVADWSYDWDKSTLATNFQLMLVCEPFEFTAGDVLRLKRFGPASAGSTIGLPGRWLVGEAQRNAGDIVTTLILVQPTQPLQEPAPTVKPQTGGVPVGNASPQTVLAAVAAAQRLSNAKIPYLWGGGHQAGGLTTTPPPAGLDCSGSVSWVLATANFPLPNGQGIGGSASVSGDFENWGQAGPGKQMTVWCNGGHVFIEFNVPGIGHYMLNTSYPGAAGPRFLPWGPNGSTDASSGAFVARHWPGT